MTTRAQVVAVAHRWLGTRWTHQASKRGVGTDCIGLVVGVARELELPEADKFDSDLSIAGYGREPDPQMTMSACGRYLWPVDDPQPGDILYMKVHGVAHPMHFAIMSSDDYMIHAYAQAKKVVENRIDAVWRSRIVRAYSYRGLA